MKPIMAGALLATVLSVSGCAGQLGEIGRPPDMSPVGSTLGGPKGLADTSRYPAKPAAHNYSLWNDRQAGFFRDPRASRPGDILTVVISINDQATLDNQTDRARKASTVYGVSADYSLGSAGDSAAGNLNLNSDTKSKGQGSVARSEKIDLSVAVVVNDVLPNGNLVISGSQEVRVNSELRVLHVAGIVRPRDISGSNTISYEKIAEARISYGGRGRLTEIQRPPWGQQVLDVVWPF
jgi:flagellar L-ring protein precursor FlgH